MAEDRGQRTRRQMGIVGKSLCRVNLLQEGLQVGQILLEVQ